MTDKPEDRSQHSENDKIFEKQFYADGNLNKKDKNTQVFLIIFLIAIYIKFKSDRDIKNRTSDSEKYCPSILIDSFIPPERAADMQANLAEVFPLWVKRYGLTAARWIRQMQIARLIIGEYGNKVLELIKAIKLAGS